MRTHRLTIVVVMVALFLSGCKEAAIQHGLDEREANEIMVLLYRHGIKAEKKSEEKNQAVTWNVIVKPKDEVQARELLVENQLPHKESLGLSGVCKDEGLIPTPKREKCRELLAYKGELINSLEKISGVIDADVVLTIPDKEEYVEQGKEVARPTASVVIKAKIGSDGNFPLKEDQVQHFVANAIPGMDPRDVAVIVSAVSPWQLGMAMSGLPKEKAPPVVVEAPNKAAVVTPIASSPVTLVPARDSAYTTLFGIELHKNSVNRFKKIGMLAMSLFLFISALLVVVLYVQIRNRRKHSAMAADGMLVSAGETDKLLGAPANARG